MILQMNILRLPAVVYEQNLTRVLSTLATHSEDDQPLVLDFGAVRYWMPAAIVALCAMIDSWVAQGREVVFRNHETCEAFHYLQRIDFFEHLGWKLPEKFNRRDAGTSFVAIEKVELGNVGFHDMIAGKVASVIAGTTDSHDEVFQLIQFSVGEIVANVRQHAGRHGFISGQYVERRGWARIGIADCGVGILESFRQNNSPHYREGMTDLDALKKAMQPWVSSRNHLRIGPYGESPNRGIGLKMILRMCIESGGQMLVLSGDSAFHQAGNGHPTFEQLSGSAALPGTVVSVLFDRGQVGNYQQLLKAAQDSVSLTSEHDDTNLFS
jgi:hypothetical protein